MKKTFVKLTLATDAAIALTACGGSSLEEDLEKIKIGADIKENPFDAPIISEAQKAYLLNAINEARSKEQNCGTYGVMPPVPPLRWDDAAYRAAYEHSYDMSISGKFSHEGSGTSSDWTANVLSLGHGSTLVERAPVNNLRSTKLGENITDTGDADYSMKLLMESDGHCYNIMNRYHTRVGVGIAGGFYTQVFAGD
jgi:uncharacterized protein YkwD